MGMLPGGSKLAAAPLGEQAGELPVPRANPKSNVRNLTDITPAAVALARTAGHDAVSVRFGSPLKKPSRSAM